MFDFNTHSDRAASTVLFLSGGLGAANEWRAVAESLGPAFAVQRHSDSHAGIRALDQHPEGAHVVAHGTAAHPAILTAAACPGHVRSLTLIDPDVIGALPDAAAAPARGPGTAMRRRVLDHSRRGDFIDATREAVDFWMGRGAYGKSSRELQEKLGARLHRLVRDYRAQTEWSFDADTVSSVVCPVLVMTGRKAPSELKDAARLMVHGLPFAEPFGVPGAKACAHLTDPHLVGPALRAFLARTDRGWHNRPLGIEAAA